MKDLESIYENMQAAFYSSGPAHESEELRNLRRIESHLSTLESIAHQAYEKKYKQSLLHEIRIIRTHVSDLINLHQAKQ